METQSTKHTTDEVVDIEEFAREAKPVPKGKRYRIRVDKEKFEVSQATITGKEILNLVQKTPDKYNLYQHIRGGKPKVIRRDEQVDLTAPGVERFTTMKVENTEGYC